MCSYLIVKVMTSPSLRKDGTVGQSSIKFDLEFRPLQFRSQRGVQTVPNPVHALMGQDPNQVLMGIMEMQMQARKGKAARRAGISQPGMRDGFDLFLTWTSCSSPIVSEILLKSLNICCLENFEKPDSGAGSSTLQTDDQVKEMPKRISFNQTIHLYRIECYQGEHGDFLKVALEAEFEYEGGEVNPCSAVVG